MKPAKMIDGKPVYNPYREEGVALVPNWLLRRPEVSWAAKLVYGRLRQYAGEHGAAWPCVQTLGTELGTSRRCATNYLRELVDLGLIAVVSGRGPGKSSTYYFVDHEWRAAPAPVSPGYGTSPPPPPVEREDVAHEGAEEPAWGPDSFGGSDFACARCGEAMCVGGCLSATPDTPRVHVYHGESQLEVRMAAQMDAASPEKRPESEAEKDPTRETLSKDVGNFVPRGWETSFPRGENDLSYRRGSEKRVIEKGQECEGGASAPAQHIQPEKPLSSPTPKGDTRTPTPKFLSFEEATPTPRGPEAKSSAELERVLGKTPITQDAVTALTEKLAADGRRRRSEQAAAESKKAQGLLNLKGSGPGGLTPHATAKVINNVEKVWREEMAIVFPGLTIVVWDSVQRGQAKNLVAKYGGHSTIAAVQYVVREWNAINEKYLRGKGDLPTIGFILKLHERIVPLAEQWSQHATILEEWKKYQRENPYGEPPTELETRYQVARKALDKLGLAS